MLKHKNEIPQNMSVEVNKNNENISLQQMKQMNIDVQTQLEEVPVVDNENTSKQSWAEMMDNDSDNLKDITNATNSWATPSTSETNIEGSTSTNEEIENAHEPSLYSDHRHEDMQTDVALHETQAESNEVTINEESTHDRKVGTPSVSGDCSDEEMVAESSDSLKITKKGNTHKETEETPIITGACPDEEMTAEPLNLYRTAENKENLQPVAATKATGIVNMQASMLSQW
ncbi:36513_t:CDS:2 [Gigaspora margarita]|uniref:36513_t:CDS:1 n=1 Tax=Gigaspora margarita TaxID=4874 RepID=A0ABN7UD34_GIGMA|nr:36513_t:CDS:2 [Gigaspora margarita]